ncbi:MAG: prenyltransferase [Chloroflexota bacterium]|nr:prenyltransferase [Chloroflexota bacterium]
MSAATKLKGIYRSTRIEITIAFVVPVLMLGVACADVTGLPIAWWNLVPGAGVVLCLLFKSNILNNTIDIDVDKRAMEQGSHKSRMYHTILLGELTHRDMAYLYLSHIIATLIFTCWLAIETELIVVAFVAFGLFMSLQYNIPPFKLAYHPFPELTMLLPSTIVAVAGVQYILISQVTLLGLFMGASFGLFSAAWFLFQSMIDYDVDKEAGKNTTPVYMGPINATIVGLMYPILGVVLLMIGAERYGLPMGKSIIIACIGTAILVRMIIYHAHNHFLAWKSSMYVAFAYGTLSATAIIML